MAVNQVSLSAQHAHGISGEIICSHPIRFHLCLLRSKEKLHINMYVTLSAYIQTYEANAYIFISLHVGV
jgi:hypothetical protein